jgi:hypothetical protein
MFKTTKNAPLKGTTPENEVQKLLAANRLEDAILKVASDTQKLIALEHGPQNKSEETKLFESLVKKILDGEQVTFSPAHDNKTHNVTYTEVNKDGVEEKKTINFNELMKKVNMNHVQFPKEYLEKYSKIAENYIDSEGESLVKSDKQYNDLIDQYEKSKNSINNPKNQKLLKEALKPIEDEFMSGKISQKQYVAKLAEAEQKFKEQLENQAGSQSNNLKNLSHAEKAAINIYSSAEYTNINNFLRQQYSLVNKPLNETILHAAIGAQALNNLPDTDIKHAIRHETIFSEDVHKARQEMAKNGGVSLEAGFISTANEEKASNKETFGSKAAEDVTILYSNLRGKYIAPISKYPEEGEYLLPPSTQLKWEGYKKEGKSHIFNTSVADAIEQLSSEEKKALSSLKEIAADANHFKSSTMKISDYFKGTINEYKKLITHLDNALKSNNYDPSINTHLVKLSKSLSKARAKDKNLAKALEGQEELLNKALSRVDKSKRHVTAKSTVVSKNKPAQGRGGI